MKAAFVYFLEEYVENCLLSFNFGPVCTCQAEIGPPRGDRIGRKKLVEKAGTWSETELANHAAPLLAFVQHADTHAFRRQIIDQYGVYP
jgi:hypothetical protein